MSEPAPIVFLLDVDNTVLDNDRVIADLKAYLLRDFDTLGVVRWAGRKSAGNERRQKAGNDE